MSNILKRTAKKTRNKLTGNVTDSISQMQALIETLDTKFDTKFDEVERTQLTINHNQLAIYNETNERVKNSGIIRVAENEIVTKIFSGLKIYLDPRDISVVPHLVLDGVWEQLITVAWLSTVKPKDTIIDIGANFGYYGAIAAQKTDKKKSKVIFFEANPNLIPYLNKTLSVNWLNEQSVVENLAVADTEGKVTLNIIKDYIGSSSLHTVQHMDKFMHNKMRVETESTVSIPAVTIDSYCKKNNIQSVDLIKMDIEGFEDKAYQGMRQTVKNSPNITLFVEFTKDSYDQPKKFYEQMLKDFGNVYIIDNEGKLTAPKLTGYESIIGDADDWVMPVFSKNSKLINYA